jgi:ATP adenylyltransferase
MRQLWSPWRMDYITGEKPEGCIFCRLPGENADRENLILHRGQHCFVVMNRYPYINGHLMIAPYQPAASLAELSDAARDEMMALLTKCIEALDAAEQPDGHNVGMNLGRAAGAGIADHLHLHVVPRWVGDTNFMSVFCETRVICEALEQTYDKLKPHFDR